MAGESARDRARRAREKSDRLARYAEKWERGADGESQTAAALSLLGAEWTRWHDLAWPGRRLANIDHLAIGPGGIVVIDSKNWSGTITVKDGVLRQNGYRRETAVAGCADSALAVGELLPRYLESVKPVLCFVRDDNIEGWARDVMLCSTTNLVAMLTSRPVVLSPAQVMDAVLTLQARMNSMPNASPVRSGKAAVPARRTTSRPARSQPRDRRSISTNRRPIGWRGTHRLLRRLLGGIVLWWFACLMAYFGIGPVTNYSHAVLGPAYVVLGLLSLFVVTFVVS